MDIWRLTVKGKEVKRSELKPAGEVINCPNCGEDFIHKADKDEE
jgi:predicted RNA-binding Zn-ribbon protein involved in translation (DUF1610 family)